MDDNKLTLKKKGSMMDSLIKSPPTKPKPTPTA